MGCWTDCSFQPAPGSGPIGGRIATFQCFECVFENILAVVVRFAGLAVFIMLLVGGFQYLTAGGDPKKAQSAKNTITYAILGLVLLLLAWFILFFIAYVTGIPVTVFKIKIV